MKVLVETSARHLHVSRADFEKLFGADAQLTNKKDLSQPGQFACFEKVTVVGPRGDIQAVFEIVVPDAPASVIGLHLEEKFYQLPALNLDFP